MENGSPFSSLNTIIDEPPRLERFYMQKFRLYKTRSVFTCSHFFCASWFQFFLFCFVWHLDWWFFAVCVQVSLLDWVLLGNLGNCYCGLNALPSVLSIKFDHLVLHITEMSNSVIKCDVDNWNVCCCRGSNKWTKAINSSISH